MVSSTVLESAAPAQYQMFKQELGACDARCAPEKCQLASGCASCSSCTCSPTASLLDEANSEPRCMPPSPSNNESVLDSDFQDEDFDGVEEDAPTLERSYTYGYYNEVDSREWHLQESMPESIPMLPMMLPPAMLPLVLPVPTTTEAGVAALVAEDCAVEMISDNARECPSQDEGEHLPSLNYHMFDLMEQDVVASREQGEEHLPVDYHMYNLIEQAQMQAEMRASQEFNTAAPVEAGTARRRRRGHRTRQGAKQLPTSDELTQCLQAQEEEPRLVAIAAIRGSILRLSLDAAGCRVVQLALEVADVQTASELVAELHGHVLQAIDSPHGNYVIQKVIAVMRSVDANFITEELRGAAVMIARHRFGCRILCRLLEHCACEMTTMALIDEILAEASDLCRHSFAHHVISCVLEYSPLNQQQQIIDALCYNLSSHASNRNSNFVIEKVLTHCIKELQRPLLEKLLNGGSDLLATLGQSHLAPHIARALSKMDGKGSVKTPAEARLIFGGSHGSRHGKFYSRERTGCGRVSNLTSKSLIMPSS